MISGTGELVSYPSFLLLCRTPSGQPADAGQFAGMISMPVGTDDQGEIALFDLMAAQGCEHRRRIAGHAGVDQDCLFTLDQENFDHAQ